MSKRTVLETKQDDHGFLEKVLYEGASQPVWIRKEDPDKQELRMPWACRSCDNLMMNIDQTPFYRWGVCRNCEVDYLEGRDLSHLKTNADRVAFCKAKKEEKELQKIERA
jgi:hypothetical protein